MDDLVLLSLREPAPCRALGPPPAASLYDGEGPRDAETRLPGRVSKVGLQAAQTPVAEAVRQ